MTKLTAYEKELKKIKKERAKIIDLTREYDFRENARERLQAAKTDDERRAVLDDLRKQENDRETIKQANEKQLIKIKCLEHNAEITFISEIIPILTEVLTPYFGKSYGEKTREKTRNELKARCNVSFYFYDAREIHFVILNNAGYSEKTIKVFASYNTPFLTDNKLNDLSAVNIHTYKRPYIENVDKHVKALYKAYDAAKTAYDDFCIKAGIYTALTVDGLKDIDKYNPKFYGMI